MRWHILTAIKCALAIACLLLAYALYEQEIKHNYPCVRCIYQRLGVIALIVAGIVALSWQRLVIPALLLAMVASFFGYYHADIHTNVIHGSIIDTCGFRADFGIFGRWDLWLPLLFEAGGNCADDSWKILNLTMPEWMRIIFLGYLFGSMLCFILWLRQSLQ